MIEAPSEWPAAVKEQYRPSRVLGQGGFASVVLGIRVSDGEPHALKVVGTRHHRVASSDMAYALREIEILEELNHPNVMKLIDRWDDTEICVMALSYHQGPTLQTILDTGGRLGLTFARVICAQLVDVVEYLHCRAVVHRDIKPDNMIISIQNDYRQESEIWDDDTTSESAEVSGDIIQDRWRRLCRQWKLTLIDFGFARALTPNDVKKKPGRTEVDLNVDHILEDSTRSNLSDKSLRRSLSRRFIRTMSAVGNQNYAAPEIINGVHDTTEHLEDVKILTSSSGHAVTDVTRTLSDHVAYYGLLVDSYSVGNVIRYCLTGVPPNLDVNDTIALENGLFPTLCRCLCSVLNAKSEAPKRRVRYRYISQIPREVIRLIRGLTQPDSQKRTSMRAARLYPWVNDVLVDSDYVPPSKISHLSFALESHHQVVEEEDGEDVSNSKVLEEPEHAV